MKYLVKLIIQNILIISIFSYISIPLKIYDNKNIDKILSLNEIEEEDLNVLLYDKINIGEPKQKVIFIISPKEYNFYMVMDNNKEIKENSFYYDLKKSKTTNIYFGENEVGSIANTHFMKEKFYFTNENINNNKREEIGINDIDLVLYLKRPKFMKELNLSSNINSYMIFGLRLCESMDRVEYTLNLIRQLKMHNITSNYKWFIDYNINNNINNINNIQDYNFQMIIGAEPHEVYPNKYEENTLRLVNAKLKNGLMFWGLNFDKIYYYNNEKQYDKILFELNNNNNINTTNFEEYLTGEIKHDLFFISSPKNYFDAINKDFFNNLISEHKCVIDGEKYQIIICRNNPDNKKYLKNNFKTLFFKHHEYNFIFELGYEDLFMEYHDKILFLIICEKNSNKWILGIPFLKKYLFTYDYDFKVIGFYSKNNNNEIQNNKNYRYKIVVIILLLLVCLIFGFFLSKKIYGMNRKKKVYEIEENFQYKEKKSIQNNDYINRDIKNNKNESLIGLEMGKLI